MQSPTFSWPAAMATTVLRENAETPEVLLTATGTLLACRHCCGGRRSRLNLLLDPVMGGTAAFGFRELRQGDA